MASDPQHRCSCGLVMEVPTSMEGKEVACLRCGKVSVARRKLSPRVVKARSRSRERLVLYTQVASLILIAIVSTMAFLWVMMPASGSGATWSVTSSTQ